jgi:LPXTG-motif cell wall-anchored protein
MKFKGVSSCWVYSTYATNPKKLVDVMLGHCRESQATMVFMFLAAALLIASGLMMFLRRRKGY